jgi:uroporphyrinogen decarboxylase
MKDRFLRACRALPVDRPPIWVMRQAGRYLPEYRALRERHDFLTLCRTPELAAEVSLQPMRRFGFDAAIVFSDILLPLEALGCEMRFDPGPRFARPVRTTEDVAGLEPARLLEARLPTAEAIGLLRGELGGRAAVIGFCGAPFTLAAYLVQGESRDGFPLARRLMLQQPRLFADLLDRLAEAMGHYLARQIEAGAQAVQLFDSWAGILPVHEFSAVVLPAVQRVIDRVRPHRVPVIYFATGVAHLLERLPATGADVIGLCWRTPLDEAARRIGAPVVLQGNLDPQVLFAPEQTIASRTREVIAHGSAAHGHVFNLGHGILPDTPIRSVEVLVETATATAPTVAAATT